MPRLHSLATPAPWLHGRFAFADYLWFKKSEQRPMQCVGGHNVMQSETICHRSDATNPSPHFHKYADHQGTNTTPTSIHSLILKLKTCYASDRTVTLATNARYVMQINSRTRTPTSTFRTRSPRWMMMAFNTILPSKNSTPSPASRSAKAGSSLP